MILQDLLTDLFTIFQTTRAKKPIINNFQILLIILHHYYMQLNKKIIYSRQIFEVSK